jgi:hypothetical protein
MPPSNGSSQKKDKANSFKQSDIPITVPQTATEAVT